MNTIPGSVPLKSLVNAASYSAINGGSVHGADTYFPDIQWAVGSAVATSLFHSAHGGWAETASLT